MKLFGNNKRQHTPEGLAERYRQLQTEKTAAENTAAELKKSALYENVKDLGPKLAEARLEIELYDAGMTEIRDTLTALLEQEIAIEYAALDDRKKSLEKATSEHYATAGHQLAAAVSLLALSQTGFLTAIAGDIQAAVGDIMTNPNAGQVEGFLAAYRDYQPPGEVMNFRAEKLEIERIARRAPGSQPAQSVVSKKVAALLAQGSENGI